MKPVLIVVAGPNGAGKTTVTRRIRQDHWSDGVTYVNPDEIAQEKFGNWNDPEAVLDAARWANDERERLLREKAGIAFETVLSMPDKLEFIGRAVDAGYFVRSFFVSTSDPAINASRVARRVMEGGHTVPIDKIISRYERSMLNLDRLVALSDRCYVYDNSVDGAEASLFVRYQDGKVRKTYGALPAWVAASVEGKPQHAEFEEL
jgi:predicted ABC-type ATPase